MALNALDGMMARELSQASAVGAVLNEVGDVVSNAALYLPLAAWSSAPASAVGLALAAVLTEFCGVPTLALGAARRNDGPMGKSDRALLVGSLALVTAIWPGVAEAWDVIRGICAGLAALTCWVRLRRALRDFGRSRSAGARP